MKYIDKDELTKTLQKSPVWTGLDAITRINAMDTIDIVRCKECKYGSDNKVYGCSLINFNTDEWHRMYADDFCSRGERKESE